MNKKLHRIAVSAFVVKDGKLLILQRSESENFLPGYWEVPGGGVEVGENIEEALVREVKEEAGLDVTLDRLFGYFEYIDRHNQHKVNLNFLCVQSDPEQDVDVAAGEMHEHAWVMLEDLPSYKMTPNMTDACKKALKEAGVSEKG